MRKILQSLFVLACISISTMSYARGSHGGNVGVHGYYRSNGTYVQPHMRTAPDGTKLNNWSHAGNVNPYTGKIGTNTDTSPNYGYRNGYSSGASYNNGYVGNSIAQPIAPSNYVRINQYELHNTRTAASYLD